MSKKHDALGCSTCNLEQLDIWMSETRNGNDLVLLEKAMETMAQRRTELILYEHKF